MQEILTQYAPFLALLVGGALSLLTQIAKWAGLKIEPKVIVVVIALAGGLASLFISPEQAVKIAGLFATGIASASGIYEYLRPFLKKDE